MNWLNFYVNKGDGNGRKDAVNDNNRSAKETVGY